MTARQLAPFVVATVFLVGAGASAGEAPLEVDGLVAWYAIDSLHPTHNGGDFVIDWPDSSLGGHHLTAEPNSVTAVFETMRLNNQPVVRIRGRTAFAVERPFELDDHTIFIVFQSDSRRRALFFDDGDVRNGLILFDDGEYHHLHFGDPERLAPYNETPDPGTEFEILVLSRKDDILGCSVNGVDLSSRVQFPDPVRVGGFFRVRVTNGGYLEGGGLQIAEMIFYDRLVSAAEAGTLTRYLSDKFGIGVARLPAAGSPEPPEPPSPPFLPPRDQTSVWLETRSFTDVNGIDEVVFVPWEKRVKLEAPFESDPAGDNTRLVCTRDGTRAELFVQLPLKTSERGTSVRLFILRNGEEYLPVQGESGLIRGKNPKLATIRLTTTLEMNSGDYVEVVATGAGEPGVVVVDPYRAALVVRAAPAPD